MLFIACQSRTFRDRFGGKAVTYWNETGICIVDNWVTHLLHSRASGPGPTVDGLLFLGLTQTIGNNIDIMFRSDNLGTVKAGDTISVIGVSAMHLFIAREVRSDSIEDANFIGGEYEENGKSLVYFNRKVKARYLSTVPVNDLVLAVESAEFYQQRRFFVCTRFNRKITNIQSHNHLIETISSKGTTYDFRHRKFTSSDGTS